MRQSKTEFTCASPKKLCFSPKRETIIAGLVLYWKRVGLAGDCHLHSLVRTFCQHFTKNPLFIFNKMLKIHYLFSTKYWLLLCIFRPPFHFSFMIKIGYFHIYSSYLSSDAFATTIINIWLLKREKKGRLRG